MLRCARFVAGGRSSVVGQAEGALFMIIFGISSSDTMRGEQQVKYRFPSWSLADSHDAAVHLPTVKVFLERSAVQLDLFLPWPIT